MSRTEARVTTASLRWLKEHGHDEMCDCPESVWRWKDDGRSGRSMVTLSLTPAERHAISIHAERAEMSLEDAYLMDDDELKATSAVNSMVTLRKRLGQ